MNKKHAVALVAVCATVLVACGGGGGGGGTTATTATVQEGLPASALNSVTGLLAYLNELIAGSSDTAEPLALGDATLPVDDTGGPAAL